MSKIADYHEFIEHIQHVIVKCPYEGCEMEFEVLAHVDGSVISQLPDYCPYCGKCLEYENEPVESL
jgi:hypothetical protein